MPAAAMLSLRCHDIAAFRRFSIYYCHDDDAIFAAIFDISI